MVYRILSIFLMIIFYSFYIYKLVNLNSKHIKTNQVGIGDKNKRVVIIENLMSYINILQIIVMVFSVILVCNNSSLYINIIGTIFEILSIVFFGCATITMKDSWRIGIPKEKTKLIVNGIYKWSRNPAFVGFDLLYISINILFFNIPLLIISFFSCFMLHLQILQEEEHMHKMFGDNYKNYVLKTYRYFGRKF